MDAGGRRARTASACCSQARPPASWARPTWRRLRRVGNVLTLDIGGTSADLALIIDGRAAIRHRRGRRATSRCSSPPSRLPRSAAGGGSHRLRRRLRRAQGRAGERGLDAGTGLLRARRHRGRPSRTRSRPAGLLGHAPLAYDAFSIDRSLAEAALAPLAAALGRGIPRDRGGGDRRRGLRDVRRGQQADRALRRRSARLHAHALRRRRADARLLSGARARHRRG